MVREVVATPVACAGADLYEMLAAGEWKSPAFLQAGRFHSGQGGGEGACVQYLDVNALERDVVIEAHVDESSGDDEDVGDVVPTATSVALTRSRFVAKTKNARRC